MSASRGRPGSTGLGRQQNAPRVDPTTDRQTDEVNHAAPLKTP